MVACAACGSENPAGSRFCNGCGAALGAAPGALPEERKVVSALFCDLVGFTATSEGADPEDVDRMLTTYFAMARRQVEAHGGVVEKFIGDAVLGVFGVPAAHEDDPERAVRAALRICLDAADLVTLGGTPLRLRVGINTGEVLVRLGVAPGSGERFLAGDTINTASRIQSVAPEMGVAVGLATYEATTAVFDYAELPPAVLKGKAEPVRVFQPSASRARLGVDLLRTHGSAYVGREIDLALLTGLFDKSVAASACQLVTVVGEPGIGKSRIVAELLAHAQARVPGLTWRQGRCLPYGDGVTFWALGEIVKAHAGILESDDPSVAGAKIDDAVPAGPDRDWLRQRLRPLVGVDASSGAEREELFAAWRTFLEMVADTHPTVLVFEDIHWADDAMLAFLEHLADRATGVPLLVVATARPELFERHATFAAGLHNMNRINLAPLSDAETGQLVAGLLRAVVPPALQGPILERAEGNPLYAEEFVRLLRDRDLVVEADGAVALRPGAELPLPESISALIAARLDTLPAERKAMLADAAVVGKVFWAGAVAAMGERAVAAVTDALRDLARKELIRPARHSSMAGEAEYAFWHVLTRDVAYAQLPRASRAARHVAAAEWLEAKAGERAEDIAEVLAHHWATALELARAAGQGDRAASLEPKAIEYLILAGDKAMNLDVAAAVASFERAMALSPPGHAARPQVLVSLAHAVGGQARAQEAVAYLEEAIAGFRAAGDRERADAATADLAEALARRGDESRSHAMADDLATSLESEGPSETLAKALNLASRDLYLDPHRTEQEERAIGMAAELGLSGLHNALIADRALRRVNTGDGRGMDDLRASLASAVETGDQEHVARMYYWLGSCMGAYEDPHSALDFFEEGLAFTRRRGFRNFEFFIRQDRWFALFRSGRWGEILEDVELQLTDATALGMGRSRSLTGKIAVLSLTGHEREAARLALEDVEQVTRAYGYGTQRIRGLRSEGDEAAAQALLVEAILQMQEDDYTLQFHDRLDFVREAIGLGRTDLAKELSLLRTLTFSTDYPAEERSVIAVLVEADGRPADAVAAFQDAGRAWRDLKNPYETAIAALGEGRCLMGVNRATEAIPVLSQAGEIFERLGAIPALTETNALLVALGIPK